MFIIEDKFNIILHLIKENVKRFKNKTSNNVKLNFDEPKTWIKD